MNEKTLYVSEGPTAAYIKERSKGVDMGKVRCLCGDCMEGLSELDDFFPLAESVFDLSGPLPSSASEASGFSGDRRGAK